MSERICDACGRTPAPNKLREMGEGVYRLCDHCHRVGAMGDWGESIRRHGETMARLRAVVGTARMLADETSDDGDPNNAWYWLREMKAALDALQPGDLDG